MKKLFFTIFVLFVFLAISDCPVYVATLLSTTMNGKIIHNIDSDKSVIHLETGAFEFNSRKIVVK